MTSVNYLEFRTPLPLGITKSTQPPFFGQNEANPSLSPLTLLTSFVNGPFPHATRARVTRNSSEPETPPSETTED